MSGCNTGVRLLARRRDLGPVEQDAHPIDPLPNLGLTIAGGAIGPSVARLVDTTGRPEARANSNVASLSANNRADAGLPTMDRTAGRRSLKLARTPDVRVSPRDHHVRPRAADDVPEPTLERGAVRCSVKKASSHLKTPGASAPKLVPMTRVARGGLRQRPGFRCPPGSRRR